MRPTIPARAALVTMFLLSACAGAGRGGSTSSPAVGIVHPGGSELVLRIDSAGGFVPVEFVFTAMPLVTISGDGTVVVQGAQDAIFPGAALAPVQARRLTEAGLQLVLAEVAKTGFFGASADFNGAHAVVADANTTVFTLHADGREVQVSVYALGLLTGSESAATMGAREREAHGVLGPLAAKLGTLDSWIPESAWAEIAWHPYRSQALRLLVRNADSDPPDPSGIEGGLAPWPLGDDPVTFGDPYPAVTGARCGVASGSAAEAWYAALGAANQLTRFTAGDHRYQVLARPVLAGEAPRCGAGRPA